MNSFRQLMFVSAISSLAFMAGCAGGGGYGAMAANPAVTAAGQSAVNAAGQAAMQSVVNSAVGAVDAQSSPMMNAILQNMAQGVVNGQLGQQVAPADRNFRLQQLDGMVQEGTVNQSQQWSNPQTGNTISIRPVGQEVLDPSTRQNCRDLEEVYTSSSGHTLREMRRACQDATGKWVLVQ